MEQQAIGGREARFLNQPPSLQHHPRAYDTSRDHNAPSYDDRSRFRLAQRMAPIQHRSQDYNARASDAIHTHDIEIENPMLLRCGGDDDGVDGGGGTVCHCRGEGTTDEPFLTVGDDCEGEEEVEEEALEETVLAGDGEETDDAWRIVGDWWTDVLRRD